MPISSSMIRVLLLMVWAWRTGLCPWKLTMTSRWVHRLVHQERLMDRQQEAYKIPMGRGHREREPQTYHMWCLSTSHLCQILFYVLQGTVTLAVHGLEPHIPAVAPTQQRPHLRMVGREGLATHTIIANLILWDRTETKTCSSGYNCLRISASIHMSDKHFTNHAQRSTLPPPNLHLAMVDMLSPLLVQAGVEVGSLLRTIHWHRHRR